MIPADTWAGLGPATIIRGDALNLPIPDSSVDLIVTSPPYFALRSYQDGGQHYDGQIGSEPTPDEFVSSLLAATREMVRVLKPSGSLWVNLGDKYAGGGMGGHGGGRLNGKVGKGIAREYRRADVGPVRDKSLIGLPWRYALRCIDELGLILRAEVVWSKPNGLPESVTDRVRRSHETWFHLVKQPRYFAAVDEIREPHAEKTLTHRGGGQAYGNDRNPDNNWGNPNGKARVPDPLGKLPGSVREVPTAPLRVPDELGVDHFAAFPPAWPAWIIRGWCPESGTVLDPFGGTGTSAMAARALGRHGISVDLSSDYCRLARWRVQDPDQLASVRGLPRQGKPLDQGQSSLLDLLAGEATA